MGIFLKLQKAFSFCWPLLSGSLYLLKEEGSLIAIARLFVGLGMTVLVACSAALIPLMQRERIWARQIHITLNASLLLLFCWQAATGLQIVQELLAPPTA